MKKCLISILVMVSLLLPCIRQSLAAGSFSDVKVGDWYYGDVMDFAAKGIIQGYPDGTFRPKGTVNKAEFIVMLVRTEGWPLVKTTSNSFTDTEEHWAREYIETAVAKGILAKGGAFKPYTQVKRLDAALMVAKTYEWYQWPHDLNTPYVDCQEGYVGKLFFQGIFRGSITNGARYFYPNTTITRAETSAIMMRVYKYKQDKEVYVQSVVDDLVKGNKFKKATKDTIFEDFMASEEALKYTDAYNVTVKDGVVYFNSYYYCDLSTAKALPYDYEYNPNVNKWVYELLKLMVGYARAENKYVKIYISDGAIKLSYYESKNFADKAVYPGELYVCFYNMPIKGEDYEKQLKYNQYIGWECTKLWDTQYGLLGNTNKSWIQDSYGKLWREMFQKVYGVQDGSALCDYSISEYLLEHKYGVNRTNTSVMNINNYEVSNGNFELSGFCNLFYTNNLR